MTNRQHTSHQPTHSIRTATEYVIDGVSTLVWQPARVSELAVGALLITGRGHAVVTEITGARRVRIQLADGATGEIILPA